MPKTSAFGWRGYIPLPHPPPMASKAGHARLRHRLLLLHLTEHTPRENPGYAPVSNYSVGHKKNLSMYLATIQTTADLCRLNQCPISITVVVNTVFIQLWLLLGHSEPHYYHCWMDVHAKENTSQMAGRGWWVNLQMYSVAGKDTHTHTHTHTRIF